MKKISERIIHLFSFGPCSCILSRERGDVNYWNEIITKEIFPVLAN